MMIKSLSRRTKSFGQLLAYIQKEGRQEGKIHTELFHNLPFLGDHENAVIKAFQENAEHLKHRKNGVALYHEILSLHPDDRDQITPQMLINIAEYYVHLRAPEGLGYGRVHTDTKNPHMHLMLSANCVGRSQKIRLSKARFQRVKQHMRTYIQRHYPNLKHTLERHTDRKKPAPSRKEDGLNRRNTKTKQVSQKDQVKENIQTLLEQSESLVDFEESLQGQGGALYTRGKQYGIIWKGKKYRLKTLGLDQHFEARKETWLLLKKRKKSVQHIYLKKFIRDWKSRGFRAKIFSALEHHTNQHLKPLQKTSQRKQGRRGCGFGRSHR